MSLSLAVAGLIGAGIAGLSSIVSGLANNSATTKANEANLDFSNKQFNYQKFLNNNQYQIQASDAQKAGINPIAMQGGSLSSGSFSAGQQATDYSGIASAGGQIGSALINSSVQKSISSKNNDTSVEIARMQTQSQEELQKQKLESEERIENARLQAQKEMQEQKILADKELAGNELTAKVNQWKEENDRASKELAQKLSSMRVDNYSTAYDLYERIFYKKSSGGSGNISAVVNAFKDAFGDVLRDFGGIPTFDSFYECLQSLTH